VVSCACIYLRVFLIEQRQYEEREEKAEASHHNHSQKITITTL
jgi:hypothetical protein